MEKSLKFLVLFALAFSLTFLELSNKVKTKTKEDRLSKHCYIQPYLTQKKRDTRICYNTLSQMT
jgi:hypothetical protein